MKKRLLTSCILVVALFGVAACGGATYDERVAYLRQVALRGVENFNLLKNQGTEVSEDVCKLAKKALINDAPKDIGGMESRNSKEWEDLIETTFVKACTTGKY